MMTVDREISNIIIIFTIGVLYWLLLVLYREINKKDISILRKNIIFKCNGWCISHFIHYMILGFLAPNYWMLIIMIGIFFEVVEIYLNKLSKYIDSKLFIDTITNTLGVIFGVLIYNIFPNKIDLYNILIK
jgi:uncharacterized protein YacL